METTQRPKLTLALGVYWTAEGSTSGRGTSSSPPRSSGQAAYCAGPRWAAPANPQWPGSGLLLKDKHRLIWGNLVHFLTIHWIIEISQELRSLSLHPQVFLNRCRTTSICLCCLTIQWKRLPYQKKKKNKKKKKKKTGLLWTFRFRLH